jgi:hypothetical protein
MAWGFRKSIGFGPFRINFSKSGVGASVGIPGLRFGVNSRGQAYRHSSIPGTGIYEREVLSRNEPSPNKAKRHKGEDHVSFELPHSQSDVIAAFHQIANNEDSDDIEIESYGMSVHHGMLFTFSVDEHPRGSIVRIHSWTDTPKGRQNALTMASGELRDDIWNLLLNHRDIILRNLDDIISTENKPNLRLVTPSDYIPPDNVETSASLEPAGSSLSSYLGQRTEDESHAPRRSTRRYVIVFAIIAIWCSLMAWAAYSPAK